jgi:PIN domain nuclease of toxin-antitoxin system
VKLLLDTHALLWWLADDAQLGPAARRFIEDPGNDVLVSTASLWEIMVKQRIGKLEADIAEIVAALPREGFALLDIRPAHLLTLTGLPMHHRDPFDHLLIAQAMADNATFVSEDRNAIRYPVQSMRCSDPLSPSSPPRQGGP